MATKTPQEIEKMRSAGLLLWRTHELAKSMVEPGVTTAEIDAEVERFIDSSRALPLFKGVQGKIPYPAVTCISINEQIVHGIPGQQTIADGDIVSIDIGLSLDGWCADCAVTHEVGKCPARVRELVSVTEDVLRIAIRNIAPGIKWRDIARLMAQRAWDAGFSVVEELVGHGIGRGMWERPQVPNYPARGLSEFVLEEGMVIAVEPMINMGKKTITVLPDHWTIVTIDHQPSAHFEHTIAVTSEGARVLTCGPNGEGWARVDN